MCIKPGVSLHSRTEGVAAERLVCKRGVRELYQYGTFLSSKSVGIRQLTFYQRQRHVNTCWQKAVIWWLAGWGAWVFCCIRNGSCRFRSVAVLAMPPIMQAEQRRPALLGKAATAPHFQVLCPLRWPDKIKLHYHRPNLTAFAAGWFSRDAPAGSLQLMEDAYLRQTCRHSQYLYWQFNGRRQGDHKPSPPNPRNCHRLRFDRINSTVESFSTAARPELSQWVEISQPRGLSRQHFSSA